MAVRDVLIIGGGLAAALYLGWSRRDTLQRPVSGDTCLAQPCEAQPHISVKAHEGHIRSGSRRDQEERFQRGGFLVRRLRRAARTECSEDCGTGYGERHHRNRRHFENSPRIMSHLRSVELGNPCKRRRKRFARSTTAKTRYLLRRRRRLAFWK